MRAKKNTDRASGMPDARKGAMLAKNESGENEKRHPVFRMPSFF
jgi:hypothetical protein